MCADQRAAPEKSNPDALAGAIGADLKKRASGKIASSRGLEYRDRLNRATALCHAIRETHPDDARQLLTAALVDLMAGPPIVPFENVREDARWWAQGATPVELLEYLSAAIEALGQTALCRDHRKVLFARLWETFDQTDRAAFLAYVGRLGK